MVENEVGHQMVEQVLPSDGGTPARTILAHIAGFLATNANGTLRVPSCFVLPVNLRAGLAPT